MTCFVPSNEEKRPLNQTIRTLKILENPSMLQPVVLCGSIQYIYIYIYISMGHGLDPGGTFSNNFALGTDRIFFS